MTAPNVGEAVQGSNTAGPASVYEAATQNLRSVTKWLLTISSSIGALLITGLQLSSVRKIAHGDVLDTGLAVFGATLCLIAVYIVVSSAARLLLDEWLTLARLSADEFRDSVNGRSELHGLFDELSICSDELFGSVAIDTADLFAKLKSHNEASRSGAPQTPDFQSAGANLRNAARNIVAFANHFMTLRRFRVVYHRIALSTVLFFVGVCVFSYSVGL